MGWLIALLVIAVAVALIIAGTHGSAAQLFSSITGTGTKSPA